MSIRFAAPPHAMAGRMDTAQARASWHPPANDNDERISDAAIEAALRHFAGHGIAAADRAGKQARAAFAAGDRDLYRHWFEVCRALDRRMARELAQNPPDRGADPEPATDSASRYP